uniref:Uncharacterized protein n=1 Tax=Anopheles atroparvus TaxID=41427 RepID=A0A182JAH1_ANOAO
MAKVLPGYSTNLLFWMQFPALVFQKARSKLSRLVLGCCGELIAPSPPHSQLQLPLVVLQRCWDDIATVPHDKSHSARNLLHADPKRHQIYEDAFHQNANPPSCRLMMDWLFLFLFCTPSTGTQHASPEPMGRGAERRGSAGEGRGQAVVVVVVVVPSCPGSATLADEPHQRISVRTVLLLHGLLCSNNTAASSGSTPSASGCSTTTAAATTSTTSSASSSVSVLHSRMAAAAASRRMWSSRSAGTGATAARRTSSLAHLALQHRMIY